MERHERHVASAAARDSTPARIRIRSAHTMNAFNRFSGPRVLPLVLAMAALAPACTHAPDTRPDPGLPTESASAASAAPVTEPFGGIDAPHDVAAPPADATRTASGLALRVLRPGTGTTHPSAASRVQVNYTGWTTDGRMFDSTSTRGTPATFPLDAVIRGWSEGVQLMTEGERARFWIPGALAYDVGSSSDRPGVPHGTLVFDIELIHFEEPPPPPVGMLTTTPPPDVAGPPADAQHTASGLAWRVLHRGTGTRHPTATSRVSVHYTGWTADGHMFDSSVQRGSPAQFPLDRVIPGWQEGVQLMTEGDRFRLWIPAALAYDRPDHPTRRNVPHGPLVFDVELLQIEQ